MIIATIEDNKDRFEEVRQMLDQLDLSIEFEHSKIPCTQGIRFKDFSDILKNEQPDVLFLDYELKWRDYSNIHAPEVMEEISRVYSPTNFPPLIILNTKQPHAKQRILDIMNYPSKRDLYDGSLIKIIHPETLSESQEEVQQLLRSGIEELKNDRAFYDWDDTNVSFFKYPSYSELVEAGKKEVWLIEEQKIKTNFLNHKNIVLIISYGVLSCIFYINSDGQLDRTLMWCGKITTWRNYLMQKNIGKELENKKAQYFNMLYFEKKRWSKFKFKDVYRKDEGLETAFKLLQEQDQKALKSLNKMQVEKNITKNERFEETNWVYDRLVDLKYF